LEVATEAESEAPAELPQKAIAKVERLVDERGRRIGRFRKKHEISYIK